MSERNYYLVVFDCDDCGTRGSAVCSMLMSQIDQNANFMVKDVSGPFRHTVGGHDPALNRFACIECLSELDGLGNTVQKDHQTVSA